jgi:hypothetical protein
MHFSQRRLTTVSFGMTLVVMGVMASGCRFQQLGDTQALLTTAKDRAVVVRPYNTTTARARKIIPKDIVCTEPSPDVATIMSKSFTFSNALEALIQKPDVQAEAAGKMATAISTAHAQALAQLTNRLATIQLLRDGLYRACEAYANGALSDIAYAVMLSGYDDVMVTLLTGELVAGNFGQSLAILGSAASGTATAAPTKASKDAAEMGQQQKALEAAHKDVATKRLDRDTAAAALRSCPSDDTGCPTAKRRALQDAETALRGSEDQFAQALVTAMGDVAAGAISQASAGLTQAVSAVSKVQQDIAPVLSDVQRKFVERINPDTFTLACLTVLSEEADASANQSALAKLCQTHLAELLTAQAKLVQFKVQREHTAATIIEVCLSTMTETKERVGGFGAELSGIHRLCTEALNKALDAEKEERLLRVRLQVEKLGRPTPDGPQPPLPAQPASDPARSGQH